MSDTTNPPAIWHLACRVEDVPDDGGSCVLIEGRQIAIFHFKRIGQWYATDNLCPHRQLGRVPEADGLRDHTEHSRKHLS